MQVREIDVRHILTRSKLSAGGYTINPYVGCQHACVYCYAFFMKRLTNHAEPWGEFVDVKVNADRVFEEDFQKAGGKGAFIGSATDAYQPLERKYELTRRILETIVRSSSGLLFPKLFSLSILTKSDLVLRDVDLLKQIPEIEVGFSISMPNEKARRLFEPRCSPVRQRIAALETLRKNGIATFAFLAPLLPGIMDLPAIFAALEGKVDYVFGESLNIDYGNRETILRVVDLYDSGKTGRFFRRSVDDPDYWNTVDEEFHALAKKHGINVAGFFHHARH